MIPRKPYLFWSLTALTALAAFTTFAVLASGVLAQEQGTPLVQRPPVSKTITMPRVQAQVVVRDLDRAIKGFEDIRGAISAGQTKIALAELKSAQEYITASRQKVVDALMKPQAPRVVNRYCPITEKKFDPITVPDERIRAFKGQKVGFCCTECPPAWDKLTDEEKSDKLNAAMMPFKITVTPKAQAPKKSEAKK
ncbi:MAG: hypothetical protein ACYSTL_08105 [Planctomycetota bacterium]|jgi:hypothetical protein